MPTPQSPPAAKTTPATPAAPAAPVADPKLSEDNRPAVESGADDLSGFIEGLPDTPTHGPQRRPGERPNEAQSAPPKKADASPAAAATPKPPETPAPKPGDKPAPDKAPPKTAPKPGRSAIDPDELLSLEAAPEEELPAAVIDELKKLPAHDLRIQSAKLAKTARQQQARLKQMESELAEAKAPKDDPEKETLRKAHTELEKRYKDTQEQLRRTDFFRSDYYKDKYEKPWRAALTEAYASIKEYTFTDPETGESREATPADFDEIRRMTKPKAAEYIETHFGKYAVHDLLPSYQKIREIQGQADAEAEKAQETAAELDRQRVAKETEMREVAKKRWTQANEELLEKYKEIFGPNPEDPEDNAVLEKGYQYVDKVHDPELPLDERIYRQAAIRHRAAALPRFVRRLKAAQARIAELEATVREYEESAPKAGSRDGTKGAPVSPEEETAEQAMEREFGS